MYTKTQDMRMSGAGHAQIAIALRVLFAMYCSGLNGSCLGSVNTHGTGMYAASADATHAASTVTIAQNHDASAPLAKALEDDIS